MYGIVRRAAGRRPQGSGLGASLAARTEDDVGVAMDLGDELRRDAHMTAAAVSVLAHLDDGEPALAVEDQLVAPAQTLFDLCAQARALRGEALEVGGERLAALGVRAL